MTTQLTTPNDSSVQTFLSAIEPERKRKEAFEILRLMTAITKENPVMWGTSIIGFGEYHY